VARCARSREAREASRDVVSTARIDSAILRRVVPGISYCTYNKPIKDYQIHLLT